MLPGNKLRQVRREAYRVAITMAMEQCGRDISAAAKQLGVTKGALKWQIRELALPYRIRDPYKTRKVRANKYPHKQPIIPPQAQPATIEPAEKKPAKRITAEELTGLLDAVRQKRQVFL